MKKKALIGAGVAIILILLILLAQKLFENQPPVAGDIYEPPVQEETVNEEKQEEIEELEELNKITGMHTVTILAIEREGFTGLFPEFSIDELSIAAGESVTFVNEDKKPHSLTLKQVVEEETDELIALHKKNEHLEFGDEFTVNFPIPMIVQVDDLWTGLELTITVE